MPPLETSDRKQKAVLWAANGFDNHGDVKVDAAAEIDVRWEEGQKEALDSLGNRIAIEATVVVDREIIIGSIMWLGEKADLATPPVNLKQVAIYSRTPDLKNRKIRRVVLLRKYSNELPELA